MAVIQGYVAENYRFIILRHNIVEVFVQLVGQQYHSLVYHGPNIPDFLARKKEIFRGNSHEINARIIDILRKTGL
jgi:hypothetical protein